MAIDDGIQRDVDPAKRESARSLMNRMSSDEYVVYLYGRHRRRQVDAVRVSRPDQRDIRLK